MAPYRYIDDRIQTKCDPTLVRVTGEKGRSDRIGEDLSRGQFGLTAGELAGDGFDRDRNTSQASFEDQIRAHDALEAGDDHPSPASLIEPHHQDQFVTGNHDTSEADLINASETDHGGAEKIVFLSVVA